ncbi:MAG: hypothetical protein Q9167_002191 [Letrouitia subvulpina]
MSKPSRGALIVIEGLDRAGKTTQCERLCQGLEDKGLQIKRMKFPGQNTPVTHKPLLCKMLIAVSDRSTPIGRSIDRYLKGDLQQEDHVIHLLFSANRWEAASQMRDDISQGTTVVIDRYYYSGIVYSAAKGCADLSLDWARQPDVGLPKPDICIFLDISPEKAAQRGGFGVERYETDSMQKRVRQLFYEMLASQEEAEMRLVDAGQKMDKVTEDIMSLVDGLFKDRLDAPLGFVR